MQSCIVPLKRKSKQQMSHMSSVKFEEGTYIPGSVAVEYDSAEI